MPTPPDPEYDSEEATRAAREAFLRDLEAEGEQWAGEGAEDPQGAVETDDGATAPPSELPPEAGPAQLWETLLPHEVDEHRNGDCVHYRDCLGVAALLNWTSFSCSGCPLKGASE